MAPCMLQINSGHMNKNKKLMMFHKFFFIFIIIFQFLTTVETFRNLVSSEILEFFKGITIPVFTAVLVSTLKIRFYYVYIILTIVFLVFAILSSFMFLTPEEAFINLLKLFNLFSLCFYVFNFLCKDDIIHLADIVLILIFITLVLTWLGFIANLDFNIIKSSGGFWNPNVGPFFLWGSFLAYVLYSKQFRTLLCFSLLAFMVLMKVYSLTYFGVMACCYVGVLINFFFRDNNFMKILYISLIGLTLTVGISFFICSFFYPDVLNYLLPFDEFFSLRVSNAAYYFSKSGDSLSGTVLLQLDSIYSEIIFFIGIPILPILFFRRFLTIYKFGNLQLVVFLSLLVSGLFQGTGFFPSLSNIILINMLFFGRLLKERT